MIVAHDIDELRDTIAASCVTIGNFDGVHMGHRTLIEKVVARARHKKMLSVVVTFEPHPLRVLTGKKHPPFITLIDQKLELISELGVELAVVVPFTRELAAMEPREFVRRYLVDVLHVDELIIGYDYAFGKNRKGNYELLAELGHSHGFSVEQIDPVIIGDAVVSSTRIRDMIQAGEVWNVPPLLGRFYQVVGTVVKGHGRGGRLLGFPTANLSLVDELVPKPGVYAVWAEILGEPGKPLTAVANIGMNPTFGDNTLSVEVYIMDLDRDLYGRKLRVHFVQRIRDEKKFSSLEELIARISEDVNLGRRILAVPQAKV